VIKNSKKLALGIDLGGTNIGAGLVDLTGKILKKKIELTQKELGPKKVIKRMIGMAEEILGNQKVTGIGIGAPGPIKKGLLISASNLAGWKKVDIITPFKKEFFCKVILDNDANAAALAEKKFGAGKGAQNLIYLTISTGIGGGIIINGEIYKGFGNAGELGHMIIDRDSKFRCGCGNYGCLEALASGTGIVDLFRERFKKNGELNELKEITAKEIFRMAKKGDKVAEEVVNQALTVLGVGIVNYIHIFNPEMIVLGGSIALKRRKLVFPFLRKFVKKMVMPAFKNNVKIVPAKLGSEAGIIGAAALAFGAADS